MRGVFGGSVRITGLYKRIHGAVEYFWNLVLTSQCLVSASQVEQDTDAPVESHF